MSKEINFITQPLTVEEMKNQMEQNNEINVNVLVSPNDMIDRDEETFDDWMDEIILDNFSLISCIQYEAVGIHEGNIILNVTGYIEDFEEKYEEYLED